jgi:hypothetical protein
MVGYIVLAGIVVTVFLGWLLVVFLEKRDRRRKRRLYDLKCERCGQQLDFCESGSDKDGCLVIEVVPCRRCCPSFFRLGGQPAAREDLYDRWSREDMD